MVLLDTGTPGTSREIYSEDSDGETRTRNPWITNLVLKPLSYTAQLSYCWERVEFIQLVIASYICHFSTVIHFSSEKYSGSTGHRNSWYQ